MLEFNALFESESASVSNYGCTACRGGPAEEENAGKNTVVVMRHGVFRRHFGRKTVTSDVNQASFFSEDSVYRVSHPANCGDRGTVLTIAQGTLHDMISVYDPSVEDRPQNPFPFFTSPCNSSIFYRHRELVVALESPQVPKPDALWVDEKVLQLMTDVLKSAFHHYGTSTRSRRVKTEKKHAELAESTKSLVATRLRDSMSLNEIARAVDSSPYHLTRVFRRYCGMPIHRYLVCLRLRTSLEMLAEGADDITALALDLGFSSHSHFTGSFRREFNCTPSEMRSKLTAKAIKQTSKNLEV